MAQTMCADAALSKMIAAGEALRQSAVRVMIGAACEATSAETNWIRTEKCMITPAFVRAMADYNRWQNESLYGCADQLSDAQRKEPRGAFFGSIHATLNHLLWGDRIWMSRFAGTPKPKAAGIPESVAMYDSWEELKRERAAFDAVIIGWAAGLDPAWLEGDLTWYSGAAKRELSQAQGPAGGAHVQPPDAPSRPGALHADPGRCAARRHRPAVPARLSASSRLGWPVSAGSAACPGHRASSVCPLGSGRRPCSPQQRRRRRPQVPE